MERGNTMVDLLAPWTKAQQALWERWRGAVADSAAPATPTSGMWDLAIEGWKAAIYGSLEVQLAWAELWKEWVCATDANVPEITSGACQTLHFMEDWTRTQMQIWDGWFAALQNLAPGATVRPAGTTSRAVKPRAHDRARGTAVPTPEQRHNGVPV